jgi:hypothetical protein
MNADTHLKQSHRAYTLKRAGKAERNRWLEIGTGRIDDNGAVHVMLDVLPIGGFNGYVYLSPEGHPPPTVEPILRRPATSVKELDEIDD